MPFWVSLYFSTFSWWLFYVNSKQSFTSPRTYDVTLYCFLTDFVFLICMYSNSLPFVFWWMFFLIVFDSFKSWGCFSFCSLSCLNCFWFQIVCFLAVYWGKVIYVVDEVCVRWYLWVGRCYLIVSRWIAGAGYGGGSPRIKVLAKPKALDQCHHILKDSPMNRLVGSSHVVFMMIAFVCIVIDCIDFFGILENHVG